MISLGRRITNIFTDKNQMRIMITCVTLIVVFFTVYFSLSRSLSRTPAFSENDILFEIDTHRNMEDVTIFSADHYRTKVHPLYVLMMNPLGETLERITHNPDLSVIFLNSLLGAVGVGLVFLMLNLFLENNVTALLFAVLFGASASQLITSIIPNTSSLSVCSLLVTYILFGVSLHRKKLDILPWILAGIFTLGVTTTNIVQTVICFCICVFFLYKQSGFLQWAKKIIIFLVGVTGLTTLLAILQKAIYPTSVLFYLPEAYKEDITYSSWLIFQTPLTVLWQLVRHFFSVNIIAPFPTQVVMEGKSLPAITFTSSVDYSIFGTIGLVFWLLLWLSIIYYFFRQNRNKNGISKDNQMVILAMSLCLLANLILHSFYGVEERGNIELFLYTGNFTFLVLGLAALTSKVPEKIMNGLLLGTIICTVINNILVVNNIVGIYSRMK